MDVNDLIAVARTATALSAGTIITLVCLKAYTYYLIKNESPDE